MAKNKLPDDLQPSCELCEYFSTLSANGESFCKYKNRLKIVSPSDVCRNFSFDIFSYKPRAPLTPKAFDFTKL